MTHELLGYMDTCVFGRGCLAITPLVPLSQYCNNQKYLFLHHCSTLPAIPRRQPSYKEKHK
jgi:hypothetical protein